MFKKIDFLMPMSSQYDVLHHFTRKLYEAFLRTGAECRLLDGNDRVLVPLRSPPDVTIGFNGSLKMEDGSFFCDNIKVPYISCLVDPFYRFLDLTKSPYITLACDDMEGCSFLERSLFMPHAVEKELYCDPKERRIYDIVFLGTAIDCERRRAQWKSFFPSSICHLMEEAAEAALGDDTTSYIPILQEECNPFTQKGVFEEVELYIKGRDRLDLLNSIEDHLIHVFGSSVDVADWSKLLQNKKNIIIHPPVPYEKSIEIMKQSKIVLNSSLKNKRGAHERVFTAAACGAVVVTNDNPFMAENFSRGVDMLLYRRTKMSQLNEDISKLLGNEKKREEMARRGCKKVKEAHTWDHRALTLMSN